MTEWIKCSERLPERETYCLAVYRNKFLGFDHQAIKCLYRTDEYWISEAGYRYLKQNITHWMPLPDAPEVEGC